MFILTVEFDSMIIIYINVTHTAIIVWDVHSAPYLPNDHPQTFCLKSYHRFIK